MKRAKKQIRQQAAHDLVQVLDSNFLKVLSEPHRVDLLRILLIQGRSDISRISKGLPQDRSVISRHLKKMLQAGLLISEKEGRNCYYRINGQNLLFNMEVILDKFRDGVAACCPQ
ncbi:MAG: winged helix-turn-helix transcriptional regulator [Proteobacteria bacterium]|nr:winged helix-turn-helix transcriptional regulator [Pseudomonadota bacterium]